MIEKDCFLLPENLFKELENSKDAKRIWKYLLKSRYREFLMTDKSYNQQHIEIYNINTSQLVNVFYRDRNEPEISVITTDSGLFDLNNEPGIFAISTDSDLFAYSYGNNIITIYLMESGLEVVSKKFDCILKIKFLEFIEENKQLLILGENKDGGGMKFHIWMLSGCLDDHFIIDHKTSILSDYDHALTKANGTIVFLNNETNIEVLHDLININTKKSVNSCSIIKFPDEVKRFKELYQLYKKDESKPELDDDVTTTVKTACGLLVHLYNDRNHQENDHKLLNLLNVTRKIIELFIENYPDYWKLVEIQYPLMALLIYSRSFSLIKFILFNKDLKAKNLHRPRSQYGSYPNYYKGLELSKSDNDLKSALRFCKDRDAVMLAYLLEYYSENSTSHIGWMINVTEILPELSKHKYAKFVSLFAYSKYRKLRYDMSSDIYMVPLPNFTTYPNEETDEEPKENGKFEKFLAILKIFIKLLRKILIPINPFKKNLGEQLSPFLQVEKNNSPFFYIPAMEAVINSRWNQTKTNWMIFLFKYLIFLVLFSYLTQILLQNDENRSKAANIVMITIFYYLGIDLFIIEFMRAKSNLSMVNAFDLCSTIFGITNLTLIISGFVAEWIILLTSVTALILWIEMLLWLRLFSGIAINIYIFGNILKIIIPFFAFMIVLTIGFGHSMFILFGYPSLVNLQPSIPTYTLNNGSENFTLTGTEPDNPFDTPLDSILSAYYWNTLNFGDYNYWPLKLLTFLANIVLVLVLLNMIIALMKYSDAFNKAKEDGKIGLLNIQIRTY
ncbi:hypothetical protein RclHR1_02180038 [Rhizophagus clarus]|uniref:Ion transport domain-containing protein n=1 Tax=Rhizophagus clarus TaxID=94130 RepID=A0A2Z6RMC9_9GLOM|nr:hypothetical protein RclHR1_02180038 [Rhizophagus clarus]GES85274.1 hypothetical protein GLOIN_2v1469593 [Rhizophagus clarus]